MVRDNEYHRTATENGSVAADPPEEDYERRMAIEEARRALDKIKEPMRSCLLLKQRSEEHTSELQSLAYLVCRLLLEKKKKTTITDSATHTTFIQPSVTNNTS